MTSNTPQLPPVGSPISADQFRQMKVGSPQNALPPVGSSIPADQFNQMKGQTGAQPSNPSFLQDEGNAISKLWNTASSPQDASSLPIGGGAAADAMVNIPASHIAKAVANFPGVKQFLTPFAVGMKAIGSSPIAQSVSGAVNNVEQKYPKTSEALGGIGKMVQAGLTTSAVGQGASALKNAFQGSQATQGISQTLANSLNYDPTEAETAANTISNTGNAARYVASGNYPAAQTILQNAAEGAEGTQLSELQGAIKAVQDLSTVPFSPTTASRVASAASGLIGGAEHLAGTTLKAGLKGLGFGAGLSGLIYPVARYEGLIK